MMLGYIYIYILKIHFNIYIFYKSFFRVLIVTEKCVLACCVCACVHAITVVQNDLTKLFLSDRIVSFNLLLIYVCYADGKVMG